MVEMPRPLDKNIARIMVRRSLRSWLKSDLISEEMLIALFIRMAQRYPDLTLKDVATRVDAEVHDLVEILLGSPLPEPEAL